MKNLYNPIISCLLKYNDIRSFKKFENSLMFETNCYKYSTKVNDSNLGINVRILNGNVVHTIR